MMCYWGSVHGITFPNAPIILQTNQNFYHTKFQTSYEVQFKNETFSALYNRVQAAGKTSTFCQYDRDCSAEEYGIRYQIVIGATSEKIREKNMIKNWKFGWLCQKGIKYESSAAWKEKISGWEVNKVDGCQ